MQRVGSGDTDSKSIPFSLVLLLAFAVHGPLLVMHADLAAIGLDTTAELAAPAQTTTGMDLFFEVQQEGVGQITVGDDALIGACSLVNRDVPPHTTVIGVPAQVINNHGSEGYVVLD